MIGFFFFVVIIIYLACCLIAVGWYSNVTFSVGPFVNVPFENISPRPLLHTLIFFFTLGVWMFCMHILHHMYSGACRDQNKELDPLNWNGSWWWATMWVLGLLQEQNMLLTAESYFQLLLFFYSVSALVCVWMCACVHCNFFFLL